MNQCLYTIVFTTHYRYVYFLSFEHSELTENKLSSARALHAELGVGLMRMHVHVVHSRVARYTR